jgi:DNA replication and repair protein RecF
MWIKRLSSKNFRTYSAVDISFEKGVNVIIGENGQGKTNLLEAIHFAITGRSFRTEKLADLIQTAKPHLSTQVEYEQTSIAHTIKIQYSLEQKKIVHDATVYPTLSSLTGTIPTIAITPSDINLIMGAPVERRRFLNLFISQHDPFYLMQLSRYQKALKARNVLLKRQSVKTIQVYETLLAQSAAYITEKRIKTIQELLPIVQEEFKALTQKKDCITFDYSHRAESSTEFFIEQYQKHRPQEEKIGTTLIGPHRDDLVFFLQDLEAKQFASEGQKRALLTALKLAELKMLKEKTGIDPILFIDDFAIHLDVYRCQLLEEVIKDYPQVFLTTPQNIFQTGSLYFVQDRSVKKLLSEFSESLL